MPRGPVPKSKPGTTIRVKTGNKSQPWLLFNLAKSYQNNRGEMWVPQNTSRFKTIVGNANMQNNTPLHQAHISVFHNDPSNAHITYKTPTGIRRLRATNHNFLRKFSTALRLQKKRDMKAMMDAYKKEKTMSTIRTQLSKHLLKTVLSPRINKTEYYHQLAKKKGTRLRLSKLQQLQSDKSRSLKLKRYLKSRPSNLDKTRRMIEQKKTYQRFLKNMSRIAE